MSRSVNSWLSVDTGPLGTTTHVPLAAEFRVIRTRVLDANRIYARPFLSPRHGAVLSQVSIAPTATSTPYGERLRLGIYSATSITNLYPGALLINAGEFLTAASMSVVWSGSFPLPPGAYYVVVQTETTLRWNVGTADYFAPDIYNMFGVGSDLVQRQNEFVLPRAYDLLPATFPPQALFDANGAAIWIGVHWSA